MNSGTETGYAERVNGIWQEGPCNSETLDKRYQYDDVNFGFSLGYRMREGEAIRIIAGIWERKGTDDGEISALTDIQHHNPRGIDACFVEVLEGHMGVVELYKDIGENEKVAAFTLLAVIERARSQFLV
ncbi:MAG TPA: hypothetical protein VJJ21_03420 [Candidatus Nanoarchaeia archaeon]|nr:hypothetical protein [Candidatus Nanoarchaeia archaeon]